MQGDKNTKFFYSYVQGKRKRLHLSEITNEHDTTLKDELEIEMEVARVFEEQFKEDRHNTDFSILEHVPSLIL